MGEETIKLIKKQILQKLNLKMLGIKISPPQSFENLHNIPKKIFGKVGNPASFREIPKKTLIMPIKQQRKPIEREMDEVGNTQGYIPCSNCGRKFNADRVQKHAKICSKISARPVFDPKRMRAKGYLCNFIKGTDLETFNQKPHTIPKLPAKNDSEITKKRKLII
jgi:hypothetical protein